MRSNKPVLLYWLIHAQTPPRLLQNTKIHSVFRVLNIPCGVFLSTKHAIDHASREQCLSLRSNMCRMQQCFEHCKVKQESQTIVPQSPLNINFISCLSVLQNVQIWKEHRNWLRGKYVITIHWFMLLSVKSIYVQSLHSICEDTMIRKLQTSMSM